MTKIMTDVWFQGMLAGLERTPGISIWRLPQLTAWEGKQGSIAVTLQDVVDGKSEKIGPSVTLTPSRSSDGISMDLDVTALFTVTPLREGESGSVSVRATRALNTNNIGARPGTSSFSANFVKLLQSGDLIEIDLTDAPTIIPPITCNLSGAGTVMLPLLEESVVAIGKTPPELEHEIHDLYVPKIYSSLKVTVTPGTVVQRK